MFQGYIAQGATQQAEANEQQRRDLADQLALYARQNPTATRDELRNYADSLTRQNYLMPGNAQGAAFDAMVRRADEAARSVNAEAFRNFMEANPDLSADEYMSYVQKTYTDPLRTPFNATQQAVQSFVDDRTEAEQEEERNRLVGIDTFTSSIRDNLLGQARDLYRKHGNGAVVASLLNLPEHYAGNQMAQNELELLKRNLTDGQYDDQFVSALRTEFMDELEFSINNDSEFSEFVKILPDGLRNNLEQVQWFESTFNQKKLERQNALANNQAQLLSGLETNLADLVDRGATLQGIRNSTAYRRVVEVKGEDYAEGIVGPLFGIYTLRKDSRFKDFALKGVPLEDLRHSLGDLVDDPQVQAEYALMVERAATENLQSNVIPQLPTLARFMTEQELYAVYPNLREDPLLKAQVQAAYEGVELNLETRQQAAFEFIQGYVQNNPNISMANMLNNPAVKAAQALLTEEQFRSAMNIPSQQNFRQIASAATTATLEEINAAMDEQTTNFLAAAELGLPDGFIAAEITLLGNNYFIPPEYQRDIIARLSGVGKDPIKIQREVDKIISDFGLLTKENYRSQQMRRQAPPSDQIPFDQVDNIIEDMVRKSNTILNSLDPIFDDALSGRALDAATIQNHKTNLEIRRREIQAEMDKVSNQLGRIYQQSYYDFGSYNEDDRNRYAEALESMYLAYSGKLNEIDELLNEDVGRNFVKIPSQDVPSTFRGSTGFDFNLFGEDYFPD